MNFIDSIFRTFVLIGMATVGVCAAIFIIDLDNRVTTLEEESRAAIHLGRGDFELFFDQFNHPALRPKKFSPGFKQGDELQ